MLLLLCLFVCITHSEKKLSDTAVADGAFMSVVFAVHVESSTEMSVNLKASWMTGAGGKDPCIVLGEEGDKRLLHVYSLHENGHHVEQCSSDLPQHVTASCYKL